ERQRLLLWPGAGDGRRAYSARRVGGSAPGLARQFRGRQVLACGGGCAGGPQAPSLARRLRETAGMAAHLSGKSPLVLPHAQAGDRAAQGAGRIVSRYLATWRDRSRAGQTAERLDRAVARWEGHAARSP